eukprot:CAMPEP_0178438938 /NCGR_PEP_ID=MMETSP0689_2-20121128/35874_1 /TAXON_ID=160604 /ORGANISM="Amphidinium massartii, Strain CS-259" /LENGTH=60 /DNA_ID=CAMNT_0020061403 /DNA_START=34 /DNA_END=216 /DNA_ORIENTATION=-
MMYNEQDQLTVCDFIRKKDRKNIAAMRKKRQDEAQQGEEDGAATAPVRGVPPPVRQPQAA